MTDEISFKEAYEAGEQSLRGLGTRLDACDRAILGLTAQVEKLQRQYDELLERLMPKQPAVAEPVPFGSIGKLVEQVESMFDCHDGDFRSYHTEFGLGGRTAGMFTYVSLGLLAYATVVDAPERLRQAFYTAFLKLKQTCKSERPMLYWRYAEAERIQEEQANDGLLPCPVKYKIRTRIAIPEADFSVVGYLVQQEGQPYAHLLVNVGAAT